MAAAGHQKQRKKNINEDLLEGETPMSKNNLNQASGFLNGKNTASVEEGDAVPSGDGRGGGS